MERAVALSKAHFQFQQLRTLLSAARAKKGELPAGFISPW
jgi:hypothetical protein